MTEELWRKKVLRQATNCSQCLVVIVVLMLLKPIVAMLLWLLNDIP